MKHPPQNRPARSLSTGVSDARGSGGLDAVGCLPGRWRLWRACAWGWGPVWSPLLRCPLWGRLRLPSSKAAVPKGLESFYGQKVEWYDCVATGGMEKSAEKTGFRCAKVKVPLDYSKPGRQTIETRDEEAPGHRLDAPRHPLRQPRRPGYSGVEMVENNETEFSPTLNQAYDIIGFDPRVIGTHLREEKNRGWGACLQRPPRW